MDYERLNNFMFMLININKDIGQGAAFEDEINENMQRYMFGNTPWLDGSSFECFETLTPLQFIYDYNKCNLYAKGIMSISRYSFDNLNERNDAYLDLFDTVEGAYFDLFDCEWIGYYKNFVPFCRKAENVADGYKFIFWALMILTVDKTDAEEHLSLICDYAKMLDITEDEFEDIIRIVKFIYNQDNPKNFKSKTIPKTFERLFNPDKETDEEQKGYIWKIKH